MRQKLIILKNSDKMYRPYVNYDQYTWIKSVTRLWILWGNITSTGWQHISTTSNLSCQRHIIPLVHIQELAFLL